MVLFIFHKYHMRKWIDLFEMKITDGFYTSVSAKEIKSLLDRYGDLRGVGHMGKIYLQDASQITHNEMRYLLGIGDLYDDDDGNDNGFDFYIWLPEEDGHSGREEWTHNGMSDYQNTDYGFHITCTVATNEIAFSNPQFKRMIGNVTGRGIV